MRDDRPEYDVGYGKPPRHGRFQKGQSGNPNGRAKGRKSLATLLAKAVNEAVIVTEKGRRKQITKLEAMTKQLANKAASGEPRATQLLIQMLQLLEGRSDEPTQAEAVDEADRLVMEQLHLRIRQMANGQSDETPDAA
jgi:hypothetical protein